MRDTTVASCLLPHKHHCSSDCTNFCSEKPRFSPGSLNLRTKHNGLYRFQGRLCPSKTRCSPEKTEIPARCRKANRRSNSCVRETTLQSGGTFPADKMSRSGLWQLTLRPVRGTPPRSASYWTQDASLQSGVPCTELRIPRPNLECPVLGSGCLAPICSASYWIQDTSLQPGVPCTGLRMPRSNLERPVLSSGYHAPTWSAPYWAQDAMLQPGAPRTGLRIPCSDLECLVLGSGCIVPIRSASY